MTDTDARLRNQLRWAIHALLVVGLGLVLALITLAVLSGTSNDPKMRAYALAAIGGFFVVYAAGTTTIVAWKASTWLHSLLVHAAAVGAIVLGAIVVASVFVAVAR